MRATRRHRSLKRLDRYAGIPLLSLLSLLPRRREPPRESVRRIAVLKTAAIGDTLLLSAALQALARAYPGATITPITGPDNRLAVSLLPVRMAPPIVVRPTAPFVAVRAIRREHFDLLIDFGSWPRFDALLAALSGARFRVGFRTAGQGRHGAFDRTVEHSSAEHEMENYRRLVAAVGVESPGSLGSKGEPCAELRISAGRAVGAERLPAPPFVVFHPWSGGDRHEIKEWPAPRWIALAERLRMRIMVTAAPSDRARAELLVDAMVGAGADAVVGLFALDELPSVLTASVVVIAVNTGVMHLAALAGARTVSLEGPVSVTRWGPVGPHVRTVVSTLPGCGYLSLGFEFDGQRTDCMDGVSVDAVIATVRELVAADADAGAPDGGPLPPHEHDDRHE